eukprot:354979-Chlamydomonas_euryale.AAC.4
MSTLLLAARMSPAQQQHARQADVYEQSQARGTACSKGRMPGQPTRPSLPCLLANRDLCALSSSCPLLLARQAPELPGSWHCWRRGESLLLC